MPVLYLCGAGNSECVRLAFRVNEEQGRWDKIILLDDNPAKHGQSILGVKIAGPFAMLARADARSAEVANVVARSTARRWSARCKIEDYRLPFATLVHPGVDVEGAEIGKGVIVYHNACVGPEVSVGDASVIFMGAAIGHESHMGRGCVVAPNAVINARVQLEDGVYVGANATILPELKIGAWATIGAGSVVMRNVPAGATVMGVPAKTLITLEAKLKLRGPESLPEGVRRDLEERVRRDRSH